MRQHRKCSSESMSATKIRLIQTDYVFLKYKTEVNKCNSLYTRIVLSPVSVNLHLTQTDKETRPFVCLFVPLCLMSEASILRVDESRCFIEI